MNYLSDFLDEAAILLDTNIIQYCANQYSSFEFIDYILSIAKNTENIFMLDYSQFELLRGATISTEEKMNLLLELFEKLPLTQDVLIAASRLETLYKMEKIPYEKISDGDKLIAATSILSESLIVTANARDFPWPYFQEIERCPLTYAEKSHRYKCIMVSLLKPDIHFVLKRFSERPN